MAFAEALTTAELSRLRKYDTPTVCNVVELFDLCPRTAGYMDARIVACYPKLPPMVGYASTATFRSASAPRSGNVYSGLDRQVDRLQHLLVAVPLGQRRQHDAATTAAHRCRLRHRPHPQAGRSLNRRSEFSAM